MRECGARNPKSISITVDILRLWVEGRRNGDENRFGQEGWLSESVSVDVLALLEFWTMEVLSVLNVEEKCLSAKRFKDSLC